MATITSQVNASLDDALIENNLLYQNAQYLVFGDMGVGNPNAESGMIFRNLNIPIRSTIQSAYITFTPFTTHTETVCNLKFVAEASSNPTQFSTYADYMGRSLGSQVINWNSIATFTVSTPLNTPDLTTIIQEVINRSDWYDGGGINIFLKDNGSDTNARRNCDAYNNGSSIPILTINYTPPPLNFVGRTTLPGYDCTTDTNIDHYSLYSDVDNIMIKNLSRGLGTVAAAGTAGYTKTTINHNLGYIPFFMVYDNKAGALGTQYQIVNNQYGMFTPPYTMSAADTNNLYILNNVGASDPYAYEIFYDNMTSGTPSFTQSNEGIAVSRPGKDISSTNPNDFIMHSDLNIYKTLGIGSAIISIPAGATGTIPHGITVNNPVESFVFLRENGKNPTFLSGGAANLAWDGTAFMVTYADPTNIYVTNYAASGTFAGTALYYLMGQGAQNTVPQTYELACTKPGVDIGTATNPDNFTFHSSFPTLKYAISGTYSMGSIHTNTFGTVPHNLGYTPFYVAFVNDLQNFSIWNGNSQPIYAITPYYLSKSTLGTTHADVGAFVYADQSNLYFNAWFDTNASGTYNFNFYYKIFNNKLYGVGA